MAVKIRVAVIDDKICLRDPKTMQRLTTKGKLVDRTSFWLRRLKAGDCILLKDIVEPKKVIKSTSKKGVK